MSEEELIEKLSNYLKDSLGKDLIKALKTTLDKLQKDNYKLDRENQHYFDRIQDLQKENEELKEQRDNAIKLRNELIEEQKITCVSKNKIRNKIKELEEELVQNYGTLGESFTTTEIKTLKKLLGE